MRQITTTIIISVLLFGIAPGEQTDSLKIPGDSLAGVSIELPSPQSQKESAIIPWRLGVVVGASTLSYVGSYFLVFQKGWWSGESNRFHFSNDFEYALNMDKFGHFYSGVLLGEGFYDALRWAGLGESSSLLWGGGLSFLTHMGIDIKDGFAEWGYSVYDVLAGTLGGFYPLAKRYVPAFAYFDFKWSWFKNSTAYYDNSTTDIFTDDYVNQTFWLSAKVHKLLPAPAQDYWPAALAIAAGLSVDDLVHYGGGEGSYEVYIGLDWDLEGAFRPQSVGAKRLVRYLNYLKLPAPALQVYPVRRIFLAYPIKF